MAQRGSGGGWEAEEGVQGSKQSLQAWAERVVERRPLAILAEFQRHVLDEQTGKSQGRQSFLLFAGSSRTEERHGRARVQPRLR